MSEGAHEGYGASHYKEKEEVLRTFSLARENRRVSELRTRMKILLKIGWLIAVPLLVLIAICIWLDEKIHA